MTKKRTSTFGNVRKLASGRYQASYWHDGRRYVADGTFGYKADADSWIAKKRTEIREGGWIDPQGAKMTVQALSNRWLGSNSRKRASSIARDRSIISNHILPVLGRRTIGSVTRLDVQRLVNGWADTKAASTVGRQFTTLTAMFHYALDAELLVKDPCRKIRLPSVSLVERPTLSADELERLAAELGNDQGAMMWVGAVLGLRWGEAAGLTVADVNFLGGTVSVAHQLSRKHSLEPPKSAAGVRRLATPEWLLDELAAVLARRGVTASDSAALLFVTPVSGTPLNYTNWRRRVWLPSCTRAELTGLQFHDLRSNAATALIASGADVKTTQRSPATRSAVEGGSGIQVERYAVGAFLRPSRTQRARQQVDKQGSGPTTPPDQDTSGGRYWTRTSDLSRVKAAL